MEGVGRMRDIADILDKVVDEILSNSEEPPMDGDDTQFVTCLFGLKLDLANGNLTDREYEERLKELERRGFVE